MTKKSEAGLVCDTNLPFRPTQVIYDFYEEHLFLSNSLKESILLNIPIHHENKERLAENLGIHIGVVINGIIKDIIYVPMTISNAVGLSEKRYMPKSCISPNAFEAFMRNCTSGQAVHRGNITEEHKSSGVLEDLSPSVLQFAPELAAHQKMEPKRSPAPLFAPIPNFGLGGGGVQQIIPQQMKQKKNENPMSFFVKSNKGDYDNYEDTENTERENKKVINDKNKAQEILEYDLDELLLPITSMIGIPPLKEKIHSIVHMAQTKALRITKSLPNAPVSLHMIFTGSPGTGKTSAAREIAKIMKELGYLEKGHLIETSPDEMRREGAAKIISTAIGGVLFIDEAYSFFEKEWEEHSSSIPIIIKMMEDHRDELIVIAAGYAGEMRKFLNANPGLRSRFSTIIDFPNYTADEMTFIFQKFCMDNGYYADETALDKIKKHLSLMTTNEDIKAFGNGRGVRNIFEQSLFNQANRVISNKIQDPNQILQITADDVLQNVRKLESISQEEIDNTLLPLNKMVGLDDIKTEINDLIHVLNAHILRQDANLPITPIVLHSIFMGPPGTGKTSVARILGQILKQIGFLEKGHVVEVDKNKLTGKFLGWSTKIAEELFHEAEGGILFIDEAYTLADTNMGNTGYGQEALTTILKLMEDHRDKVVVICAGYEKEMKYFLQSNSGLSSRFPRHLHFKSYNPEDMVSIFKNLCENNQYTPTPEAIKKIYGYLLELSEDDINKAGNGRLVRNIFEKTIVAQSKRITSNTASKENVSAIKEEDIRFPQMTELTPKVGFV